MASSVRYPSEQPGDTTMAEINITPFTDVLLVLLIIFMLLSAIAVPPGFQKTIPKQGSPVHTPEPFFRRPIEVDITGDSRISIDGKVVPAARLYQAMADAVRSHGADPRRESEHIDILGSAAAPYDAIIRVMDAGRQAGDDDVGLVIE